MTGSPTRVLVGGVRPYDVVVGAGVAGELDGMLDAGMRQVGVIHSPAVRAIAQAVIERLATRGHEVEAIEVPDAEAAKDVRVAAHCWSVLGRRGFTRSDAIIGVGGGAVTDLAGFVAATWLRGVRIIHVPTTLLGMVDAAIGGKTAINTAEGKNLVGAFHPPAGVLCDLSTLATLPADEYVSGLAEVIKAGFIADPVILDLIEADPAAAVRWDGGASRELIERAIRVKAAVVADDLRESGHREILNYGHTLAHAIEKVEGYRFRHGEAVSVGMVYAAELGRIAGRLSAELVDRHRKVLDAVGLRLTYPGDRWLALLSAMKVDKKARGERLRFVVLDGLTRPAILDGPDPALLVAAYSAIRQGSIAPSNGTRTNADRQRSGRVRK